MPDNDSSMDMFTIPVTTGFIILFQYADQRAEHRFFTNPAHGDKAVTAAVRSGIEADPTQLVSVLLGCGYQEAPMPHDLLLWNIANTLRFLMYTRKDTTVFKATAAPQIYQ